ncbi:AAA family ATPase [uncultured Dialister sp.]|uniref:AAA family ATPase n=1 Tax=uncultured Dialister sp. TaxID=278064 RepID=UPI00265D1274|nr:AAA family ATPase [uncultured Dialister sp.]
MNRFYLNKLIVSGGQHQSSIIEFNPGFNLIIGPSNTGKSFIMDCLDYALGASPSKTHPSKVLDANNGYELISLELTTRGGSVTLNRKIGDSKIEVISSDPSIKNGRYSVSNTAKKNINSVFLSLLGIDSEHKILSSENGNTQNLSWRTILHFFFLRQADIARETSPLITPGWNAPTPSIATLLFLLTGKDANNLQKQEDPAISKAKKKALLTYIQEKLDDLSKRRAELEKAASQCEIVDIPNAIKELKKQIQQIQNHIDTAVSKGHSIMSKIYDLNGKLSECETVIHNFSILHQQYQSDIHRLEFIIDGSLASQKFPTVAHCPFCNSKITTPPDTKYIEASSVELKKTKTHIEGLFKAKESVKKKRQGLLLNIKKLEEQKNKIDLLISNELTPQLFNIQQELEEKMNFIRISGELECLQQNELQYRKELFDKETEEDPVITKRKIADFFDYDLIHGFEENLIKILTASKIGGANTARLNMQNFDIEINGKSKPATMGGGFCALLNTITTYAMSEYIIEQNGYAPYFFASDSSLTQLSESEQIQKANTIKHNFIQYLVEHALSRQVIMIEQKERMPFIPKENPANGIHIIEFTGNKYVGRYGFLNDVFNIE